MTEWIDETQTRQGLYRFVGAALTPPTRERLDLLGAAAVFLDNRSLDRYAFARDWRRVVSELSPPPSLDELEVEYVRLFGVGMRGTPAMPTESYYRVPAGDGGIADFVSNLQREYRSMGLVTTGMRESPDHISTEMDVMSYLCGTEADAWDRGDADAALATLAAEARFLRGHLAVWVPLFADRARNANAVGFYGQLVDFVHAFVVHEADYVHGIATRSVAS